MTIKNRNKHLYNEREYINYYYEVCIFKNTPDVKNVKSSAMVANNYHYNYLLMYKMFLYSYIILYKL